MLWVFMLSAPIIVGKDVIFLGCHVLSHSSCQVLLPRYLVNGLKSFDKTDHSPYLWHD